MNRRGFLKGLLYLGLLPLISLLPKEKTILYEKTWGSGYLFEGYLGQKVIVNGRPYTIARYTGSSISLRDTFYLA